MDVKEMIQRLRVVGAKVHADDGHLVITNLPDFAKPLADKLRRKRLEAVRCLLDNVVRVWVEGLEEPIWVATDAKTAAMLVRRTPATR